MLYRTQYEAMKGLQPEQFKAAFTAIMEYALDDIEPDSDPVSVAMWMLCKPLIDKNNRNYANGKKSRATTGSDLEPNEERTTTEPGATCNRTTTEPQPNGERLATEPGATRTPNDKCKRLNIKKSISKDMPKEKFKPPTADEVRDYAAEKGYAIDAERFCDFYESKGWFVGKNPMKDWKAAVRNWSRSQKPARQETTTKRGFVNYDQRKTDYDAMIAGGWR